MNWYSVFYWLTVADSVKQSLDTFSNIFVAFTVLFGTILFFLFVGYTETNSEKDKQTVGGWIKHIKRAFYITGIFSAILWISWAAVPTKKDALIIIAGGAVGNFVTQDSSAKKIPAEVMQLLRTKIAAEIKESTIIPTQDTLEGKTKEELIELLKQKE